VRIADDVTELGVADPAPDLPAVAVVEIAGVGSSPKGK
jgi:hypothetical protein